MKGGRGRGEEQRDLDGVYREWLVGRIADVGDVEYQPRQLLKRAIKLGASALQHYISSGRGSCTCTCHPPPSQ